MANRVQLPSFQVRARASAVEKLDAAFIALTRAAEARERQQAGGMVDLVDVVMDVGDIYIYHQRPSQHPPGPPSRRPAVVHAPLQPVSRQ